MGLPFNDTKQLDQLAKGFYDLSGGMLDGCMWAIDGFAVRTQQPYNNEVLWRTDC
jgi:hypothetical protein